MYFDGSMESFCYFHLFLWRGWMFPTFIQAYLLDLYNAPVLLIFFLTLPYHLIPSFLRRHKVHHPNSATQSVPRRNPFLALDACQKNSLLDSSHCTTCFHTRVPSVYTLGGCSVPISSRCAAALVMPSNSESRTHNAGER